MTAVAGSLVSNIMAAMLSGDEIQKARHRTRLDRQDSDGNCKRRLTCQDCKKQSSEELLLSDTWLCNQEDHRGLQPPCADPRVKAEQQRTAGRQKGWRNLKTGLPVKAKKWAKS